MQSLNPSSSFFGHRCDFWISVFTFCQCRHKANYRQGQLCSQWVVTYTLASCQFENSTHTLVSCQFENRVWSDWIFYFNSIKKINFHEHLFSRDKFLLRFAGTYFCELGYLIFFTKIYFHESKKFPNFTVQYFQKRHLDYNQEDYQLPLPSEYKKLLNELHNFELLLFSRIRHTQIFWRHKIH